MQGHHLKDPDGPTAGDTGLDAGLSPSSENGDEEDADDGFDTTWPNRHWSGGLNPTTIHSNTSWSKNPCATFGHLDSLLLRWAMIGIPTSLTGLLTTAVLSRRNLHR